MSILSWIGFGLIALGAIFMWREHQYIIGSQISNGKVIELVASRGSKGGTVYAPKVSFKASDGREAAFVTKISSSKPGVAVGDVVNVVYRLDSPGSARLLSFAYRFGFAYCAIGAGLLLLFIGYGFKFGDEWVQKTYLSSSSSYDR